MATTTNYGWTTPDDTALVKDGAAAIRTLGTSVDTTTKNLNPSTTLGDIEYRSSTANTNTRLGIGTTGQVLTVSGGVPSWATSSSGGMTLISTTTLSGASTTISSIPQTFTNLEIIVQNVNCSSNSYVQIAPNNVTNLVNSMGVVRSNATNAYTAYPNSQFITYDTYAAGNTSNIQQIELKNYASSTAFKPFVVSAFLTYAGGASTEITGGAFRSNTAVTSLVFSTSAGTFSGGTVLLYGVK